MTSTRSSGLPPFDAECAAALPRIPRSPSSPSSRSRHCVSPLRSSPADGRGAQPRGAFVVEERLAPAPGRRACRPAGHLPADGRGVPSPGGLLHPRRGDDQRRSPHGTAVRPRLGAGPSPVVASRASATAAARCSSDTAPAWRSRCSTSCVSSSAVSLHLKIPCFAAIRQAAWASHGAALGNGHHVGPECFSGESVPGDDLVDLASGKAR